MKDKKKRIEGHHSTAVGHHKSKLLKKLSRFLIFCFGHENKVLTMKNELALHCHDFQNICLF
jgi:hypothetical protein